MIGEGTEHDKKKSEHQRFRKLTFIIKNLGGGDFCTRACNAFTFIFIVNNYFMKNHWS